MPRKASGDGDYQASVFCPILVGRLMVMAIVYLLPAAFGRLVAYFTRVDVSGIVLVLMCVTLGACICIDPFRHRRLHAAFACSGAPVIAIKLATYLAQTAD